MKKRRFLDIKGALIDKKQLEIHLEKVASEHNLQKQSNKNTYPINRLVDNFVYITKTYELLNLHLKEEIIIHPAGEWLLDNYYIIEQTYSTIKRELTLKKYTNFVGISNGMYQGFARIYVLASEIVASTDGKIDIKNLNNLLRAYQNKKTLNMEEIWNICIFFYIGLIEKIRNVCERIYYSQMQKQKVENIIKRLVEKTEDNKYGLLKDIRDVKIEQYSTKETFIEYLSYRLKSYGKKGLPYIKILEEEVAKTGTTISDVIKKEHFDIALIKVYIGNYISSIKEIQRINFTEIFEELNGVENILKKDPADVYSKMDHATKDYYRNQIKRLAKKTKISEIYIATKALELAQQHKGLENDKSSHIGYYLIDKGTILLNEILGIKEKKAINKKNIYIASNVLFTSIITLIISVSVLNISNNLIYSLISLFLLFIPISEIVIKIQQYILSKIIKPKLIPKVYFQGDIPKQYSTMIVIPTILDSTEKVKEMFEKMEVYYLANQSENLYFTLLGDCISSSKEEEQIDKEIIKLGRIFLEQLNKKYPNNNCNIFNFIYRQRRWNSKESCYLGWERKRGILKQFNEFLVRKELNKDFLYNSFTKENIPTIKYIITLDADTELVLGSAKALIGSMAHILNTPILDNNKKYVISGYGIIQPRINIGIEESNRSLFTKLFAGNGGVDFYSNAVSDIYQDNFHEGIFTGKGIYDLEIFNTVLNDVIPENSILSHDLLEGLYLKCGLATDIFLLDSYPTNYNSYITRQTRWIRGDWQILPWLFKRVRNRLGINENSVLGELDKFKILDNLRRSLLEVTQSLSLIFLKFIELFSRI